MVSWCVRVEVCRANKKREERGEEREGKARTQTILKQRQSRKMRDWVDGRDFFFFFFPLTNTTTMKRSKKRRMKRRKKIKDQTVMMGWKMMTFGVWCFIDQ